MSEAISIEALVGSTITIFLTGNLIYPTRSEVEAKVHGIATRLELLHQSVLRLEEKVDEIKDFLTRPYNAK